MKQKHIHCISCIIFTILLVAGCKEIEPFEITSAKIFFYSKNDAPVVQQPEPMIRELSQSQIKLIQSWLNANRAGWLTHSPAATLFPNWCIETTSTSGKTHGLCRYESRIILRGLDYEIEKTLTEQDNSLFIRIAENAHGKH